MCIRNLSGKPVTLPSRNFIGAVSVENVIPPMLAPKTLVTDEGNLDENQEIRKKTNWM